MVIRNSEMPTQDAVHSPIERRKAYLSVMLAGAMTVTLLCGLLLLLLTVTQLIPQARKRIELASEPPAPTATLWCPECERAGRLGGGCIGP